MEGSPVGSEMCLRDGLPGTGGGSSHVCLGLAQLGAPRHRHLRADVLVHHLAAVAVDGRGERPREHKPEERLDLLLELLDIVRRAAHARLGRVEGLEITVEDVEHRVEQVVVDGRERLDEVAPNQRRAADEVRVEEPLPSFVSPTAVALPARKLPYDEHFEVGPAQQLQRSGKRCGILEISFCLSAILSGTDFPGLHESDRKTNHGKPLVHHNQPPNCR